MTDILDDLRDLHRSKLGAAYRSAVINRAIAEIKRLRHLQAITTGIASALLDLRTSKPEEPRLEAR